MELHKAIIDRDEKLALELVDEAKDLDLINEAEGLDFFFHATNYTPLMSCCAYGMAKVANKLISKVNINLQNKFGFTALHYSCIDVGIYFPKYEDIAISLIDGGADLYLTDRSFRNCLDVIYHNKATKVIDHLQYICRKSFYESINDSETIVGNSFLNPIADLHVLDIFVEYCF